MATDPDSDLDKAFTPASGPDQEAMLEGYRGTVAMPEGAVVTCPSCGHEFTPGYGVADPVRMTEAEQVTEALVEETGQVPGRVLEAKGTDEAGGRIFRVQIIAAGDSRNRRRYPLRVLQESAKLYDGAKAYDHHRTPEELQTSTIAGLVGGYRDVEATAEGLEADLHLLPGATHAAQVLDAALASEAAGLPTLAGVSHDVLARYRTIPDGGRHLQEATQIVKVQSVDIVADPAAGGRAVRMVAGGEQESDPPEATASPAPPEEGNKMDPKKLREALGLPESATDAEVRARLTEGGVVEETPPPPPADPPQEPEKPEEPESGREAVQPKGSLLGRLMIREAVAAAKLPDGALEKITAALPEQVTEALVDRQVGAFKELAALFERSSLTPQAGSVEVTKESREKKIDALDAMFAGDFTKGYHSIRQAWQDITGARVNAFDGDVNRRILRESAGHGYDSAVRATEALDSATWAQVLGDSITRRMVADYRRPGLDNWRLITSDIVPISDFRTNRRTRFGGYGTLPAVAEAAPYQPLTSPGDEEATYAISKKGGLESLTLEVIANDDVSALRRIPQRLGRAAAWTLYRDVWGILTANAAVTYDAVALFHASHGNTASSAALAQSTLSTGRRTMRDQTAYGDSTEILGPSAVPRTLIVPNELEELAFQLTSSAVAVPASGNSSDIPNLHTSLNYVVVDILTDANDWFLVADPASIPTIEVGFFNGRQEPELFTQADPQVGSMFDSDELTYKIRFVYGTTVLDHRGFYRGQG